MSLSNFSLISHSDMLIPVHLSGLQYTVHLSIFIVSFCHLDKTTVFENIHH